MSSFAAPLHCVTTSLMVVGAFACVWLAVSRPELAPRGWARFVFGLGWALLGVAETLHGAQFMPADSLTGVLGLRTVAYFLLLISLLVPVSPLDDEPARRPPGGGPAPPGGRPASSLGWAASEGSGRPGPRCPAGSRERGGVKPSRRGRARRGWGRAAWGGPGGPCSWALGSGRSCRSSSNSLWPVPRRTSWLCRRMPRSSRIRRRRG